VIRRTARGKSPLAADRDHLHHRLMNMGHSHRQSVLLMYLWAALFSGTVVGLSQVRLRLIWLALATVGAMAVLLLATMPRLRPWRSEANGRPRAAGASRHRSGRRRRAGARVEVPATSSVSGVPPGGIATGGLAAGALSANGAVPGGFVPGGVAPGALPYPAVSSASTLFQNFAK